MNPDLTYTRYKILQIRTILILFSCFFVTIRISDSTYFSGYNPTQRCGHRERPDGAGGAVGGGPQGGRDTAQARDQQARPAMASG